MCSIPAPGSTASWMSASPAARSSRSPRPCRRATRGGRSAPRAGCVTPGLVDIHAHVFVNAHDMGGHTDHFCRQSGVTTLCDAGSAGSANFAGLRHVLDHEVRTRVRAFVNLSAIGIIGSVARRRAVAFPLCRSGRLRPHDQREPRPRDRRQAALRARAWSGNTRPSRSSWRAGPRTWRAACR